MAGIFVLPDLIITMADLHQSLQEAPEKEDIRMLGRMLGDVIREQEGEEIFNLVEKIRRTAVSFRRNPNLYSADTLNNLLKNLSRNHAISVVRAFSYFSHLANIAVDKHANLAYRAARIAGEPPEKGSLNYALDMLEQGRCFRCRHQETVAKDFHLTGSDRTPY